MPDVAVALLVHVPDTNAFTGEPVADPLDLAARLIPAYFYGRALALKRIDVHPDPDVLFPPEGETGG